MLRQTLESQPLYWSAASNGYKRQIIDDPDAYIARTAGAHQALAGRVQSLVGPSAHSEQVAGGAGAVTGAREVRTRKVAQGATVMTASNVRLLDNSYAAEE